MNVWYIRAQLASSLLVVVGRYRQFGKVYCVKKAIDNYCGSEVFADYCGSLCGCLLRKFFGSRLVVNLCQWRLKVQLVVRLITICQ